ncbi:MAG: flagella basal body P-ring formation protein FlgA [Verrucomicrobiales bacterium]|nr:flagella basal body P-ring formation protein FlgA [Verrucomicrobiales bacterium]|tara:strand:+ start:581 stop:1294 length:714 start_codon:yes stop_codon:yes gene_type:complete
MKRLGGILLQWTAAATILAAAKAEPLPAAELGAMLKSELRALLLTKGKPGELELTPTRPLPEIEVPTNSALKLEMIYHPGAPMAYMRVKFALSANERRLGEWTVYYRTKLYRDVWVANAPAQTGTLLNEVELRRERRDVINVRQPLWDGSKPEARLSLRQGVASGSLIYERMLKSTPVVKRGQVVQAFVQIRALSVRMKVEVLEDGAPGETVRMRNLQNNKVIRGTVINENFIRINL